jgi:hypothetical protein
MAARVTVTPAARVDVCATDAAGRARAAANGGCGAGKRRILEDRGPTHGLNPAFGAARGARYLYVPQITAMIVHAHSLNSSNRSMAHLARSRPAALRQTTLKLLVIRACERAAP